MKPPSLFLLLSATAAAPVFLAPSCSAHSYITRPLSRGAQGITKIGCSLPRCAGPCEVPTSAVEEGVPRAVAVARGQTVTLEWPRISHPGGFVRLAWAQFANSDDQNAFDANVHGFTCFERGACGPAQPHFLNGPDIDGDDGSRRPCSTSIVIPPHLIEGVWTLQWILFGNGGPNRADFYSCVDFRVTGGPSGIQPYPYFLGGDYSTAYKFNFSSSESSENDKASCKFFSTNRMGVCKNPSCTGSQISGDQYGRPDYSFDILKPDGNFSYHFSSNEKTNSVALPTDTSSENSNVANIAIIASITAAAIVFIGLLVAACWMMRVALYNFLAAMWSSIRWAFSSVFACFYSGSRRRSANVAEKSATSPVKARFRTGGYMMLDMDDNGEMLPVSLSDDEENLKASSFNNLHDDDDGDDGAGFTPHRSRSSSPGSSSMSPSMGTGKTTARYGGVYALVSTVGDL